MNAREVGRGQTAPSFADQIPGRGFHSKSSVKSLEGLEEREVCSDLCFWKIILEDGLLGVKSRSRELG